MKKIISLIALTAMLAVPVFAQTSANVRVNSLNALVQLPILSTNLSAMVSGNATIGDGPYAGSFTYDPTSSAATNTYGVFKPAATTGRWIRRSAANWNQFTAVTVGDENTYTYRLHRNMATNVFGIGADNNNVYLQSQASYALHLNNQGNNTILNATAGNVGIGTTGPGATLDVEASGGASVRVGRTSQAYLQLDSDGTDGTVLVSSGGALKLKTNGDNTRVYIKSDGNVGIGTTSPAGLLHVSSDTAATGVIYLTQANASADGPDRFFRKARGTAAAPTVITTADELGVVNFTGYGGAAGYIAGAAIKGISSGTIADSRVPGQLSFWTGTDAAPSVLTERVTINNAGTVTVANNLAVTGNTTHTGTLTQTGTAAFGGGAAIVAIYSAAAQLDFGSIAANTAIDLDITVAGAGTNSVAIVSRADGAMTGNISHSAWVSAPNTVTVRALNPTVGAIDPAAGSFRTTVFQY